MLQKSENGGQRAETGNQIVFPKETVIGALAEYISAPNKQFQPMNANFGILPKLQENIKDKQKKYEKMAERALKCIF